ncbi:anthranilate synthase component II [uncultured bacterium]|nr:anthranilate synthase component II [uncultured bacterium]
MGRALVIRHVAHEGLGILKRPIESDSVVEYVDLYRGASVPSRIDGYDGLVVLGGPMGVYEDDRYSFIRPELKLIEDALKKRVPMLGICLGSQLLAKAAGAKVYKGSAKEIGWHDVTLTEDADYDWLFLGFPDRFRAFHWHGDTFDVPEGGLMLASSELFPNQVIKVGPAAYGIQFHLEVTEQMIREWICVNHEELAALKGKVDPKAILDETPERIETLNRLGAALGARFSRMIEK